METLTVFFYNQEARTYQMELQKLIEFLIDKDLVNNVTYIRPENSNIALKRFTVLRTNSDAPEYYFAFGLAEMVFEFLLDDELETVSEIHWLHNVMKLTGVVKNPKVVSLFDRLN